MESGGGDDDEDFAAGAVAQRISIGVAGRDLQGDGLSFVVGLVAGLGLAFVKILSCQFMAL